MMNSFEWEIALRKALEQVQEEKLASLPDDSALEKITFSAEFEQQMDRMVSRQKQYWWFRPAGRNIACIFVALFTLSAALFGIRAAADPSFLTETYEKFSALIFSGLEEAPSSPQRQSPAYLPAGYALSSREDYAGAWYSCYSDYAGNTLTLEQNAMINIHCIDTESSLVRTATINGSSAQYVEKNGTRTLIWSDGRSIFLLSGSISESELLAVAQSLQEN